MPGRTEDYEVLLDFVNDTHDCATVQLLRDYGRNSGTIVLLRPGESVTLVLDAGTSVSPAALLMRNSLTCVHRLGVPIRAQNAFQGRKCYVSRDDNFYPLPETFGFVFAC